MSWGELLPSVAVGGALPVSFAIGADSHQCVISMTVPCVDTGRHILISRTVPLPPYEAGHAEQWVRAQVHWFYRHEADEQVRINGRRPFEPVGEHVR